MSSVHTMMSGGIAHYCRVNTVPSIVGVVSGRVHTYTGQTSLDQLRAFVESLLPSNLVAEVSECGMQVGVVISLAVDR